MTYAEFAMTVPPFVQALLSVVLTVGISVVLVWACHRQLLVLSEEPKHNEGDPTPEPGCLQPERTHHPGHESGV